MAIFPQPLRLPVRSTQTGQTQILILKIPNVFLRLKSSSSLTLEKISHFWMHTKKEMTCEDMPSL